MFVAQLAIGPCHNDITAQSDRKTAVQPCINGVYGYLGYPTAWMMYQLQNDDYAHGAFVNGTGEMFSQPLNLALAKKKGTMYCAPT